MQAADWAINEFGEAELGKLHSADALCRGIARYSVIAWRVLYATLLARQLPDLPCTVLLETDEWQALYCCAWCWV